jgi:hypothetical protein
MKKNIVLGTLAFAALSIVVGLGMQIAIELLGATSQLAGQIGTFLIAIPLALVLARRIGRLTHFSVLVASIGVAVATLWAIVFVLDSIAAPAGGHVGWANLFNEMNWRNTVFGSAAMLVAPQVWLSLLNRLAANNSSKPTPLRGAA